MARRIAGQIHHRLIFLIITTGVSLAVTGPAESHSVLGGILSLEWEVLSGEYRETM